MTLELRKSKTKSYTHAGDKPDHDLYHNGEHVGSIKAYSAYKDTKAAGSRLVSKRKDVAHYAVHVNGGKVHHGYHDVKSAHEAAMRHHITIKEDTDTKESLMFVDSAVRRDVKAFTEESNKIITARIDGIVAEMRKIIGSKLFSEEVVNEAKPIIISQANKKAAIQKSRLQRRLETLKKTDKKEDVDEEEDLEVNVNEMDSAFKGALYGSYTTKELQGFHDSKPDGHPDKAKMHGELERRKKVQAGDRSVMTAGERLRHARNQH